jgi:hypothetical protein
VAGCWRCVCKDLFTAGRAGTARKGGRASTAGLKDRSVLPGPLLNNSKQGPNKTIICSEKFVAVKVAVSSNKVV